MVALLAGGVGGAGGICSAAFGQWPTDPSSPLLVASGAGERNQPKIVATGDGGCFVSWFDNAPGGWDVRMQRLDAMGVAQFLSSGAGGLLVADRGFSSTQDYDLMLDVSGHAVVVYRDDVVTPGVVEVSAQRVSPLGALTWGEVGAVASNSVGSANQPKVTQVAGGDYIVGWSQDNAWRAHRLDASGAKVWAGEGLLNIETSRPRTLNALRPGGDAGDPDGSFIASFVRATGTGFGAARQLYSQKFDSSGAAVWNGGLGDAIVFDATSLQFGAFPPFESDGAGGAAYSWYETGGVRGAYVRRADENGTLDGAVNIVDPVLTPGRISVSASSSLAGDGSLYLAGVQTDAAVQNQNTVIVQRVLSDGSRAWGPTGVALFANTSDTLSFVQVLAACDGAVVVGLRSAVFGQGTVFAAKVKDDGSIAWQADVATSGGAKTRLVAARGGAGGDVGNGAHTLLAFGDGPDGARHIAVVRVNDDGTLGFNSETCGGGQPPCPCDRNADTFQTVADFFSFLNDFNAQLDLASPRTGSADFDGSGFVTPADFFAFLNGCLGEVSVPNNPCP